MTKIESMLKQKDNQKRILVIAGPTGVGESTVTKKIINKYPKFKRLVTATTRQSRYKEKNKVDYYFFTEEKFKKEIEKGNIIEYQNTRDNIYYGSYKPDLEKKLNKGFNIIINPDIVGAKYYKKNYNATTIFLMPDSMENLKKRHYKRNPNITSNDLKKRLAYAKKEIEKESSCYDYKIINAQGKINETINQLIAIIKKENYKLN